MYTDPNFFFNNTLVPAGVFSIENGTSINQTLYTITEVYGMDLAIQLLIIIAFFQVMLFVYMVFGRNLRRFKK
jgi:hypothetical protein